MRLPITVLLISIVATSSQLIQPVLADREQEMDYYSTGIGGGGDLAPPQSSSSASQNEASRVSTASGNKMSSQQMVDNEDDQRDDRTNLLAGGRGVPIELVLLPRLLNALAERHRNSAVLQQLHPILRNSDGYWFPPSMSNLDDNEISNTYRGYNKYLMNSFDDSPISRGLYARAGAAKRDRSPVLSIQAPMETLRQRIQLELKKKQQEKNRKLLTSLQKIQFPSMNNGDIIN